MKKSTSISAKKTMRAGMPNLKFGVLGDIHVTTWESAETFRSALKYYREADVDAVMICGDLSDYGVLCNLESVAKSWYCIFPDDKGLNGKHVEKVFIYGNHDVESDVYGIGGVNLPHLLMNCPGYRAEEVRQQAICKVGLDKVWEKCFHEKFEPIYHKKIRGYDFFGAHWDTQAKVRGLEEWFAENGKKLDPSRPFFYCQHPHPKDTVYVNGFFTHDDGSSTRIFSNYPNAVVFSGHSHITITDERSLWRGAFTSIGASLLSQHSNPQTSKWIENLGESDPTEPARQGMLVSVYDDRMVIERRDFFWNEEIDDPWILPVPAKPVSFAERAVTAEVPQFEEGKKVFIRFGKRPGEKGLVRFPPAIGNSKARAFDYEITIEYSDGLEILERHMFRAYGPAARLPKSHEKDVTRIEIPVRADYLPKYDVGQVRVTVAPRNSLGTAGKTIDSGWISVPKM